MEQRTVHKTVPKTSDIEIHISTLATEFGDFVDVREYVVSLEQYGRGITIPAKIADAVGQGLEIALDIEGQ